MLRGDLQSSQKGRRYSVSRFRVGAGAGETRKQDFLYDGSFRILKMIHPDVAELEGLPLWSPKRNQRPIPVRRYHRLPNVASLCNETPPPPALTSEERQTEWEVEEDSQASGARKGERVSLEVERISTAYVGDAERLNGMPRPTTRVPRETATATITYRSRD